MVWVKPKETINVSALTSKKKVTDHIKVSFFIFHQLSFLNIVNHSVEHVETNLCEKMPILIHLFLENVARVLLLAVTGGFDRPGPLIEIVIIVANDFAKRCKNLCLTLHAENKLF